MIRSRITNHESRLTHHVSRLTFHASRIILRKQFRDVHRSRVTRPAAQSPANVHQAAHIAGDDHIRAALLNAFDLVFEYAARNIRILDREQASKSAALVGPLQFYQLDSLDAREKGLRFGFYFQLAQQMTRLM